MIKHGARTGDQHTPEYMAWQSMRARICRTTHEKYPRYGGRGISIVPEWDDFSTFLADMGARPGPEFSLERVDNDAGYSKENCMWVTKLRQAQNRSSTKLTEEIVTAIRWEWPHVTQRKLAARYGVTQFTISDVVRFKSWRSIGVGHD